MAAGSAEQQQRATLLDVLRRHHGPLARRRLVRDALKGLRTGLLLLALLAGCLLLARGLGWTWGQPLLPELPAALLLVGGAALLLVCTAGAGLLGRRPHRGALGEVAQRLDRAAGTRGRLTAAYEFSAGPATPFERAAVEDGVRAAAGLGAAIRLDERIRPGGFALSAAAAGVLLMGLLVIPPATGSGPTPEDDQAPPRPSGPGGRAERVEAEAPPERRPSARTPVLAPPDLLEGAGAAEGGALSGADPEASEDPASGRPRPGASRGARRSPRASRGTGQPAEGAPPSESGEERSPGKGRKGRDRPSRMLPGNQKKESRQGATTGLGASSGGAMSPVPSPWSQRDRSTNDPLPENPADEEVEDEESRREARGGAQPLLKDRRAAPSRELSISGPGQGGEGRGGPSPQKKARGTASLVMGVPVPDFVRSLLNPGTVKITHERVPPVPGPGAPADAVPGPPRTREPRVIQDPQSWSWMPVINQYLIELHEASSGQER